MADRMTDAPGRSGEFPPSSPSRRNPQDPDRTREAVDDVRQSAAALLDETRRDGKKVLDRQKDAATEEVGAVASALRSAADDLHRQDHRASRFVEFAADRLESFGNTVRNKDIDSLIDEAERLGRRSPAAFFAGSVALGFLLSRFLKSSARSRQSEGAQRRQAGDSSSVPVAAATPDVPAWPSNAAGPISAAPAYPHGADRPGIGTTPTTEVTR